MNKFFAACNIISVTMLAIILLAIVAFCWGWGPTMVSESTGHWILAYVIAMVIFGGIGSIGDSRPARRYHNG